MKKLRKHCLYCGEIITKKYEDGVQRDFCSSCKCFFYENPLPVVSCILESSRQILLVKRDRPPSKGSWCLPTRFAAAGHAQSKFWPVNKIPPLAFRSNRKALDAYIKSRKDYWAIFDSIEHADEKKLSPKIAKNSLTRRLANFIVKNKEEIINQWLGDAIKKPS